MKTKNRKVEIDCENPVLQSELISKDETNVHLLFDGFVRYALKFNVSINVNELYNDYKEKEASPAMIAFASWKLRERSM